MPTFRRAARIDAPLDEVWTFHSRVEGLEALTPDWMGLRVEAVRGPDGESDPDLLETGSSIRLSARPFGIGPRQRWTSRIVRRERGDGAAVFEDVMEDGPFPEWRHVHGFYATDEQRASSNPTSDGGGTLVRDRVEYQLPVVGGLLGPLGWLGFEPMFRYRHHRTRQILEGERLRTDYQRPE